ncbi:MAG: 1-acyl-sn-glycerol-3-phosphate acyltransferase [Chloroflexi bacterium]|nr:1-acyl-sn-glycerol-3-phosphate acyltransferase [Chloroflexota bacterium]
MKDLVYNISKFLMRGSLRLFARWQVIGVENVPPMGPLIVVANHLSNLDPPLLMSSLPRRLQFLAKRPLFALPPAALFLRAYGAHPVAVDEPDVAALLWVRRVLRRDGAIALFPEAHRNPGKGMQKGAPGIALLALRTQAPILPIGITGTGHIGAIWRVVIPTGDITVRVGQPFSLPIIEGKLERAQLQELTDTIMRRVAMLLPSEYQGVYQLPGHNTAPSRARV